MWRPRQRVFYPYSTAFCPRQKPGFRFSTRLPFFSRLPFVTHTPQSRGQYRAGRLPESKTNTPSAVPTVCRRNVKTRLSQRGNSEIQYLKKSPTLASSPPPYPLSHPPPIRLLLLLLLLLKWKEMIRVTCWRDERNVNKVVARITRQDLDPGRRVAKRWSPSSRSKGRWR